MAGTDPQFNPLQFSLINDEPVAEAGADLLGARDPAQQLAALLVTSRSSTPFTLAVDSGWGTGKSSLMRLVDRELTEVHGARTVWYNAWTSTGAEALEGLIKSVLAEFDKSVLRRTVHKVSKHATALRTIRALLRLLAGPFGLASLVNELWRGLSVSPQARNEMRDAIREAVRERVEAGEFSPKDLLVVFIDDLDRCPEETVLKVCEAVKVYLDVPGLAFVIGCDRSALASNGLLRDLSPAGSAFMEKIFQTTYRMPVPDGSGIEEFIRSCAEQSGVHVLLNDGIVSRIAEHSRRNPRRIKKLINGFVLEVGLNPLWRDFVHSAADSVVSVLVLQHLYPDFYRMLVGRGSGDGDVLAEFQTYRKVRLRVKGRLIEGEDGAADDETVARFFVEHVVPPPSPEHPDDWDKDLESLESELPREFPGLFADRGFTTLIDDLEKQPHYEELIKRLRQQPLSGGGFPSQIEDLEPPVPGAPEQPGPPQTAVHAPPYGPPQYAPSPYGDPYAPSPYAQSPYGDPYAHSPYGIGSQYASPPFWAQPQDVAEPAATDRPAARTDQRLAGMRILWIDDNPDTVGLDVRTMRRAGAHVEVVEDRAEAERHLTGEDHDLLISDITRGEDHEAGFTDVEGLRRGGYYSGPVIFFTGRVTPAREAKAEELGAGITASPDGLHRLVVQTAKDRSQDRSSDRASDGDSRAQ